MKINKAIFKEYLFITFGVILLAFAINTFYTPNNLVTGGFTGISIIIEELTKNSKFPLPIWFTNFFLNVPVLILALKVKGFKFIIRTGYSISMLSLFIYIFSKTVDIISIYDIDLINCAVFGGLLSGAGLGLILKNESTTGGTDLISTIVNKKFSYLPTAKILLFLDGSVIISGLLIFGINNAMYALIVVFIVSKVIQYILQVGQNAKAVFIISNDWESISREILYQLNRGVTSINGRGMYTKTDKQILLCVLSLKEVHRLKNIVESIDASAFLIITEVRETLGIGFSINKELNNK